MKYSILMLLACTFSIVPVSAAGSISGVAKGADGTIITVGAVTASRQAGGARTRLEMTSASAAIRPDGSFTLPPLAYGAYQICAHSPGTAWLNSCEWGGKGTTASLTPTQVSVQVSIVLTKGALVTVRVNDAAQLLAAHEGKTPGAHLLIGVAGDSLNFSPADVVSQDAAGRNYRVLIPFDRTVNISVASAHFQLNDQTGRALPKFGNVIPVRVTSGQQPPTVMLGIGGAGKP